MHRQFRMHRRPFALSSCLATGRRLNCRAMKSCGFAWVVILLLASTGAAQSPVSRPAGAPPPFRRSSGKPLGLTPEIDGLLRKLVSTYQRAGSYRDQGRVTLVQQTGRVKTTTETPLELTFQRPNLLRLDAGHYIAACDG